MGGPGVFLDRDGVINCNRPDYVRCWADFAFLPGVLPALTRLAGLGWPVVVVSNQAVVGRGLAGQAAVDQIHERMVAAVTQAGGRIDGVLCCPHRPEDGCGCRKPQPGLLLEAATRWGLELGRSYLVGDAASDVLAAQAVGCHPVLVRTGRGIEQSRLLPDNGADGVAVVDDLAAAVSWILERAASCR
jgi:D-glycero-D-manno-heptose 1,7-bisphosphate phosphatase